MLETILIVSTRYIHTVFTKSLRSTWINTVYSTLIFTLIDSLSSEDSCSFGNESKIFNEQWSKDKKNKSQTLSAFGSNPQPILEKIEFKVTLIIESCTDFTYLYINTNLRFSNICNVCDNSCIDYTCIYIYIYIYIYIQNIGCVQIKKLKYSYSSFTLEAIIILVTVFYFFNLYIPSVLN